MGPKIDMNKLKQKNANSRSLDNKRNNTTNNKGKIL